MKNQITIYFDTSFYVQLCRLDKAQADELLDKLNMLNVRHVVSDAILKELLSSADRSEKDALLFERVNGFAIPPLLIGDFPFWKALLIEGDER